MNIRTVRRLALGFGLVAIFAAGSLNAAGLYSSNVTIPFEFKAGKTVFGAGQYRVDQEFGKDIAYVVNLQTGRRAQVLRSSGTSAAGRANLVFEHRDGVRFLKKLL